MKKVPLINLFTMKRKDTKVSHLFDNPCKNINPSIDEKIQNKAKISN